MGKRRSMMRAKKYDDVYNKTKIKPWSDLTHDVLSLVMMKLEVADLFASSGVCKSWRSFALSNRPPMSISILTDVNEIECRLKDCEGRKFKTTIPHSASRTCIGVTCGHLILYGKQTNDFWLVNPITTHEIHFPDVPDEFFGRLGRVRATLVFSPIIYGWVFVIYKTHADKIWFSIAGKQEWTHVSISSRIHDLHGFKGKIYILDSLYSLYEMILYPKPRLMLLETKNFPTPENATGLKFASSSQNLYVIDCSSQLTYKIHELDFGEMKWVSCDEITTKYALYFSQKHAAPVLMPDDPPFPYINTYYAEMWYLFHDCLNVK